MAPRVALTAAHCLEGLKAEESHLLLGYDRGSWQEHLQPRAMRDLGFDLAALCLDQAAAARPLPLAQDPAVAGEPLTIAGYGRPRVHVLQATECRVAGPGDGKTLRLDCPSPHGKSGAPVLRDAAGSPAVVAIAVASSASQTLAVSVPQGPAEALCAPP